MQTPNHCAQVVGQRGDKHSHCRRARRVRRTTRLNWFLAIVLSGLLPMLAQASSQQGSLGIRIQILPSAPVATLPESVQRLDSVMPGYGDHWTHARTIAATDPLHAVRTLRDVHQRARDHHGADAWLDDMVDAGQGLFADQDLPLVAGFPSEGTDT